MLFINLYIYLNKYLSLYVYNHWSPTLHIHKLMGKDTFTINRLLSACNVMCMDDDNENNAELY